MKPIDRQPMKWMADAPIKVSQSRDIDAEADAVFAVLADHERWPDWFKALSSAEVTGAASGVGAERRVTVGGLGAFDEEFLTWEPGKAFGFSVVAMQRPVFNTLNELITIEPRGDGVRVTYTQAFEPKLLLFPIMRVAAKTSLPRALRKGLEGLAAQVETA